MFGDFEWFDKNPYIDPVLAAIKSLGANVVQIDFGKLLPCFL